MCSIWDRGRARINRLPVSVIIARRSGTERRTSSTAPPPQPGSSSRQPRSTRATFLQRPLQSPRSWSRQVPHRRTSIVNRMVGQHSMRKRQKPPRRIAGACSALLSGAKIAAPRRRLPTASAASDANGLAYRQAEDCWQRGEPASWRGPYPLRVFECRRFHRPPIALPQRPILLAVSIRPRQGRRTNPAPCEACSAMPARNDTSIGPTRMPTGPNTWTPPKMLNSASSGWSFDWPCRIRRLDHVVDARDDDRAIDGQR